MRITKTFYHPDVKKAINKYPHNEKVKIIEKIDIFLVDPFTPSLKTHKLTGRLCDCYSFSISYRLRVLFRFIDDQTVEFIDVGGHEIYK